MNMYNNPPPINAITLISKMYNRDTKFGLHTNIEDFKIFLLFQNGLPQSCRAVVHHRLDGTREYLENRSNC